MTRLLTWSVLVGMLIAAGAGMERRTGCRLRCGAAGRPKPLRATEGVGLDGRRVGRSGRGRHRSDDLPVVEERELPHSDVRRPVLPTRVDLEGIQIIGFDAAEGKIRSWVFDSDGGIGEGRWTRDGNQWTVQSTHVLPDGRKAKATRVITRVDDDAFTLKSTDRELDGESLPDVDEVKIVRKK